jgi:hypothetical protein
MPPAGFETAVPASERQEPRALDRAATGVGIRETRIRRKCRLPVSFVLFVVEPLTDWQDTP